MKYFLAFDKKRSKTEDNSDRYIPIYWNKLDEYKNKDFLNLVNICNFTMIFCNYEDLVDYLISKNIAVESYKGKEIVIVYKFKNKYKHLKFGISYGPDKKYFDLTYLRMEILSHRSDLDFLKRLAIFYRNNPIVMHLVNDLLNYVSNIKNLGESDINFDNVIDEMIMRICYKYNRKNKIPQTNINGELVVDERPLRDLAMFVINYNKNKEKISKKSNIIKSDYEVNPFILKRNFPVYEQTTLFD